MTTDAIKFLLVDDTEENLIALEALLRRDGLEILTARSGAEALELLLVHDVALAFLDVQMAGMDGFELAELMRGAQRTRHVPIIFVTAGSRDPQRVFRGYDSGAVDFLFKPIDPVILKSKADVFFELQRQRNELAGALRLSEMFVGILGHDLRNPLGTMMTGTQLLAGQARDEREQRTLRRMLSAGHRMTEMIEQLLDLTRARLGRGLGFATVREAVDVSALVQRTVDELRGAHPACTVAVEASGDTTLFGDPNRLLQVFSNLVANALQHGAIGRPISVRVVGDAEAITVVIHNEGAIAAPHLETLFDPFRSHEAGRPRSGGLGLGLYIAHQIAIAHGGDLTAASSEATGTTFTVRLPRAR